MEEVEEVEDVEDVSRATDLHLVWINSLVKSWSHAGAAEMGIKLAFKLSHARSENHRVFKSFLIHRHVLGLLSSSLSSNAAVLLWLSPGTLIQPSSASVFIAPP